MWVADQGTGVATMYEITTDGSTDHEVPLDGDDPHGHGSSTPTGPTGVVQDPTNEFLDPRPGGSVPATYIFDTLQGTIAG